VPNAHQHTSELTVNGILFRHVDVQDTHGTRCHTYWMGDSSVSMREFYRALSRAVTPFRFELYYAITVYPTVDQEGIDRAVASAFPKKETTR
jgi:hypothetical protein